MLRANTDIETTYTEIFSLYIYTPSGSSESDKFTVTVSKQLKYDSSLTTEDITLSLEKADENEITNCTLMCSNCDLSQDSFFDFFDPPSIVLT